MKTQELKNLKTKIVMEKKAYITPNMEVMEMEIEAPMLSASSGSGGSDGNAGVFDDVTDDDANMSIKRRGKWGDLWC